MRVYIETYGCQMNVSDSEVILSILAKEGWIRTDDMAAADLMLVNTCSVRDNAEQRVLGRLEQFNLVRRRNPGAVIGVVGCMAQRMGESLLGSGRADIVCGPDSYRRLPSLLQKAEDGTPAYDTTLSRSETYADVMPLRTGGGVSAFISIMRGCNNVCSYCVVPYTRGVERSRSVESILAEALDLGEKGYREITLLGQNVDSYRGLSSGGTVVSFAGLLDRLSLAVPGMRIRFSTSNPHDLSDDVLHVMAERDNLCKHIHLPVQSGSDRMLEKMRRKYDSQWYLGRVETIRRIMPDCGLSTDIIAGFCGETLEDHEATLALMDTVRFDSAFMFKYSERPGTMAARKWTDDVPEEEKTRRLNEIIGHQMHSSAIRYGMQLGKRLRVLVEGPSRRSPSDLCGRASNNMMCVFPDTAPSADRRGQYVEVEVLGQTGATLLCEEWTKQKSV